MKKVTPVLVLAIICIIVTGALAAAFQVTDPIVQAANAAANEAARVEVLPEGSGFSDVTADYDGQLPKQVTGVSKADNDAGYIFNLTAKGYGKMAILVAIRADGTISGVKAMDISGETPGIGSKVADESFYGQFVDKDSALEGVDTISGATISSKGYMNAVKDAFAAFEIITGKGAA